MFVIELLGAIIFGLIFGLVVRGLFEGLGGGGIAIKGTDKYNKYQKNAEARVSDLLKNGSGSSKDELQEWWDTHHKK